MLCESLRERNQRNSQPHYGKRLAEPDIDRCSARSVRKASISADRHAGRSSMPGAETHTRLAPAKASPLATLGRRGPVVALAWMHTRPHPPTGATLPIDAVLGREAAHRWQGRGGAPVQTAREWSRHECVRRDPGVREILCVH